MRATAVIPASPMAAHAIHAAQLSRKCGRYPAQCYAMQHGVTPALLRLACQLLAMQRADMQQDAQQQRMAAMLGE